MSDSAALDVRPCTDEMIRGARHLLAGVVLLAVGVLAQSEERVVPWGYYWRDQGGVPFFPVEDREIPSTTDVVCIAAGAGQDVALQRDGTVVVWGDNGYGQAEVPSDLEKVTAVASGAWHVLAVKSDRTVTGWGCDTYGQATPPAGLTNVVAVEGGVWHSLALKADGTVVGWGQVATPAVPPNLSNVVAISCGNGASLALKADGTVFAWSTGSPAAPLRPVSVPSAASNVVAISAGDTHHLALRADGTVLAWGGGDWGEAVVPEGLSNVVGVAAGGFHSLALKADGTVVGWGAGTRFDPSTTVDYGQALPPDGLSNVAAIDANEFHSLALVGEGTPFITQPMVDRTVLYGTTPHLYIAATGARPFSYRWRFNGVELEGATNSVLTLPDIRFTDAGTYSVIVSNALGSATSMEARLAVKPLFITAHPEGRVVMPGWKATFQVAAASSLPLAFQWQHDGVDIPAATNSLLVLSNAQPRDAGVYGVVVANGVGAERSQEAYLSFTHLAAWGANNAGQTNVPPGLTNIAATAGGTAHSLALLRDGTVVGWGSDQFGQLAVPASIGEVRSVSAGARHSLALKADGTVAAWGDNSSGQTQVPSGLSNVVAVAAGESHNLALRADGTLAAWGNNSSNQCDVPAGLSNVVRIAAGSRFSVALKADGGVVTFPPLVTPTTSQPLSNVVEVAAGSRHYLALRADGSITTRGSDLGTELQFPFGLSNVVAVAAGGYGNVALQKDGTVQWWSTDPFRFRVSPPPPLLQVAAVAAGSTHALAQIGDGPPLITTPFGRCAVVAGGTAYFHVGAVGRWPLHYQWRANGVDLPGATNATLVLRDVQPDDARSYSVVVSNEWGAAASPGGELAVAPLFITGQPQSQSTFVGGRVTLTVSATGHKPFGYQWFFNGGAITGATNSSLALTNLQFEKGGRYSVEVSNVYGRAVSTEATVSVGQVVPWGNGQHGQTNLPAGLTNLLGVAAGGDFNLALTMSGMVIAWGDASFARGQLPGSLTNVIALACGARHALALLGSGTVVGWGDNAFGQADIAMGLTNVVAVSAGAYHSLALLADGTVTAAGYDEYGQINIPWDLADAVAISAGGYHNLALKADGSVVAWGDDGKGATDVPSSLTNVVAIAAGGEFSLALRADGTVAAWGGNDHRELSVPAGLADVAAVKAGYFQSVALKRDGTVVGWGDNSFGQSNVPSIIVNPIAIASGATHNLAVLGAGQSTGELLVLDPRVAPEGFSLSVATWSGRVYALEHTDTLASPTWTRSLLVAGNGARVTLTDSAPNPPSRFYRVRCW